MIQHRPWSIAMACALALATLTCHAHADDIRYRSFSASAAIGPPAAAFAVKLDHVTSTTLGDVGRVHFVALPGIPAIPASFGGDIIAAVSAGEANGGFDAAYISGSDLNKTWGFLFNSGIPLGPSFDEFLGFLASPMSGTGDVGSTGSPGTTLDLVQSLELDKRGVMALPIVGSPEQLSGYFLEPLGPVAGRPGIGLAGLCEQHWTLRYLPPGEDVLKIACDTLVREGRIRATNLGFIEAVPGGGSLVDALSAGTIQGFEFATPVDDVSQLFVAGKDNPGTLGARFVHTPGWQQQFLLTWMIINKARWNSLGPAQQILVQTVARDHVLASYADNVRTQGAALTTLLTANQNGKRGDDMVLTSWPTRDLARLSSATIQLLNRRIHDSAFPAADRTDYARFLDALRAYVHANDRYWDHRQVDPRLRFKAWTDDAGHCWSDPCDDKHGERGEHGER